MLSFEPLLPIDAELRRISRSPRPWRFRRSWAGEMSGRRKPATILGFLHARAGLSGVAGVKHLRSFAVRSWYPPGVGRSGSQCWGGGLGTVSTPLSVYLAIGDRSRIGRCTGFHCGPNPDVQIVKTDREALEDRFDPRPLDPPQARHPQFSIAIYDIIYKGTTLSGDSTAAISRGVELVTFIERLRNVLSRYPRCSFHQLTRARTSTTVVVVSESERFRSWWSALEDCSWTNNSIQFPVDRQSNVFGVGSSPCIFLSGASRRSSVLPILPPSTRGDPGYLLGRCSRLGPARRCRGFHDGVIRHVRTMFSGRAAAVHGAGSL